MSLILELWLAGTPNLDAYLREDGWTRNPTDPGVWSKDYSITLVMREEPEKGRAFADGIREAFPDFDVPDTFTWCIDLDVSSSALEIAVPLIDHIRETCPTFLIDPDSGNIIPADAPFDTWRNIVARRRVPRMEVWTTEIPDSDVTDVSGATWTTDRIWSPAHRTMIIQSVRGRHEDLPESLPVVLTVEAPKAEAKRVFAEVVHALRTRQPFVVTGDFFPGPLYSDEIGPDWEPPYLNG